MSFLDPIMSPLLSLNPFLAILLVSFSLSVLITLIYKLATDQEVMKTLKADLKQAQLEMKKFKEDPQKMLKIQEKAMQKNMKYMMHSMKPTLFTMIPIILIFGWLNSNFSYEPLTPGVEFDTIIEFNNNVYGNIELKMPKVENSLEYLETNQIKEIRSKEMSFKFRAIENGVYNLVYILNNETDNNIQVVISEKNYGKPIYKSADLKSKEIKQITIGYPKKIVADLGFMKLGWLGTYIILSLIFSIVLRKILKLH
jgi:uncharacterized membrane protein (DUF106 family)